MADLIDDGEASEDRAQVTDHSNAASFDEGCRVARDPEFLREMSLRGGGSLPGLTRTVAADYRDIYTERHPRKEGRSLMLMVWMSRSMRDYNRGQAQNVDRSFRR